MEAVILIGIQGCGKSSFLRERFFDTHVRINLDMLRTHHREELLLRACLEGKQPFVIDRTNVTRRGRARFIAAARAFGFRVVGYFFDAPVEECLRRNAARPAKQVVPPAAVHATLARLERPTLDEGFDALFRVRIAPDGAFIVDEWEPTQ